MANIGIFHYKVGGTDGVSLEIDKWKLALEEMGHTVHLCAGDLGELDGALIPEMHHHRPESKRLYRNTFIALEDFDATGYQKALETQTEALVQRLDDFVKKREIGLIIAQNVWSVAMNPAVAVALEQVRQANGLPAIAHNHDFYWERVDGVALTCRAALELADKYLPPRSPDIRHVVINSLAQRELAARKGVNSHIVPNVFDFEGSGWQVDDYNRDFRASIGLSEKDVLILQATRIVPRKAIELAIDFVKALNARERRDRMKARGLYDGRAFGDDSRIVLVMAGYSQDDATGQYPALLKEKAAREGVETLFIEDVIDARRGVKNGRKAYSLWDAYVFADFVTYPSIWEGWGNQFLEAVRARLPIALFEYPVYAADIKARGFRVASFGNRIRARDERGLVTVAPERVETAADMALAWLTDAEARREVVEHNFRLAQQHYSMPALRQHLATLLAAKS
ncbi:MAG: glycosyltransferase family 4 protein [Chloroflexi bacterium]|nr:glycosyltransferase family 4 protein [Chloroflexota bacterium]